MLFFFKTYSMTRLYTALIFLIAFPLAGFGQSSITVSYDGIGVYSGVRLKYAHSFEFTQVGGYASAMYVVDGFGAGPVPVLGICVNSVPASGKNVGIYAGGSIEYFRVPDKDFVDHGYLIGPQLGMLIHISNQISLNTEWGLRGGLYNTSYENYSPGGAYTRYEVAKPFLYVPASIGLTYTFHKRYREKE